MTASRPAAEAPSRPPGYSVVVPTIGRPSLHRLLTSLAASTGPAPCEVIVVDDRPVRRDPLLLPSTPLPVRVLAGRAAGPAAARNRGWRAAGTEWVAFLDDDVEVGPAWRAELAADLARLDTGTAASQGHLSVPLPAGRRPTDWERNVAGLGRARWATADMAYRRRVLADVGGFDERFRRAYREDSDLALRVMAAGHRLAAGRRISFHPVLPTDRWVSVRLQAGNADDVLMRRLHGSGWRRQAAAGPGRTKRHLATAAVGTTAVIALIGGRRRPAAAALAAWAAGTAELTIQRIRPGPRDRDEVVTMLATSAVLPFAATFHWLRGWIRRPPGSFGRPASPAPEAPGRAVGAPRAILFDRDGTLVVDVPYNGDPGRVSLMPGARSAVERARRAGVAVGLITNQSGVGRGLLTFDQVEAVNRRLEDLVGRFDVRAICPHGPDEACACRKPAPGLVREAAARLGVEPSACAVIGDIGADVEAAVAAGARAVLVPTPRTRPEEIDHAVLVASDVLSAVDLLIGDRP